MANEVQKFDPSTLMDGVKARIRAEFASLIPDEAWTEMVKKEVDYYFHDRSDYGWNNSPKVTPFESLVRKLVEDEARRRLGAYLSSEEFNQIWLDHGQFACSKFIEDIIVKNSGSIMVATFGTMFQSILEDFKNKLRNNY